MRELETPLPDLTPPAGGLARLQQSVAAARRPAPYLRPSWAIAVAVCAVAAMVAVALPPWVTRRHHTNAIAQALRHSVAPSGAGIKVAHGAAIELPSGQANVKLYLVQTDAALKPRAKDGAGQSD